MVSILLPLFSLRSFKWSELFEIKRSLNCWSLYSYNKLLSPLNEERISYLSKSFIIFWWIISFSCLLNCCALQNIGDKKNNIIKNWYNLMYLNLVKLRLLFIKHFISLRSVLNDKFIAVNNFLVTFYLDKINTFF